MPVVLAKAEKEKSETGRESMRWTRLANRWWQLRDYQPGTMAAIAQVPRYIACSRVTKRPVFEFISRDIHPDNTLIVFPLADDYSFGILQSGIHWGWFTAKCSTLTARFRYTSDTVFDTFPWPQFAAAPSAARRDMFIEHPAERPASFLGATCLNAAPDGARSRTTRLVYKHAALDGAVLPASAVPLIRAVAEAARALRALRREIMAANSWSLRDLYRTLETPGSNRLRDAHAALDTTVRAAYGMKDDEDILAFLLKLNLECAAKEAAGERITPPGLSAFVNRPGDFVTQDCVTVEEPGAREPAPDGSTSQSYADAAHYYAIKEEPPKSD